MPTKAKTPEEVLEQIGKKGELLNSRIDRIRAIEAEFPRRGRELKKLVDLYNSRRLDGLIERLIEKGLAYCPSCKKLVKEYDFGYREKSGTYTRTRNTYWDYEEHYHYTCYECMHCKREIQNDGKTLRETWIKAFKSTFKTKRKSELPQEIILALPESALPPEPIQFSEWNEWGSVHKDSTAFFYVRGPGISIDGWTTQEEVDSIFDDDEDDD